MTDTRLCADCGKTITPRRHGPGWVDKDHLTVCRAVVVEGVMHSADYHYVAGEEQRHWKVPS